MAEIVDFAQAKLENSPHLAMLAICLGCRKEWTSVAPIGMVSDLECPGCGLMKGVSKTLIGGDNNDMIYRCKCGSEALTAIITPAGAMRLRCMLCGIDHHAAVCKGWSE